MQKLNLFSKNKIEKINLSQISGGTEENTGYESNISKCTSTSIGFGQSIGDTDEDGDWISTC